MAGRGAGSDTPYLVNPEFIQWLKSTDKFDDKAFEEVERIHDRDTKIDRRTEFEIPIPLLLNREPHTARPRSGSGAPLPAQPDLADLLGDPDIVYDDEEQALLSRGWADISKDVNKKKDPEERKLGKGAHGSVSLGKRYAERSGVPVFGPFNRWPEETLCGIKQQDCTPTCGTDVWKEVLIMRCLVHDNIVDYYDHFIVIPPKKDGPPLPTTRFGEDRSPPRLVFEERKKYLERMSSDKKKESSKAVTPVAVPRQRLFIIMEYADAGTLVTEIRRYPLRMMPESGCIYYAYQMLSALRYMYRKQVYHNDCHAGNVLMKYLSNGKKKVLLVDFGLSVIHAAPDEAEAAIAQDVLFAGYNIKLMVNGFDDPVEDVYASFSPMKNAIPTPRKNPKQVKELKDTHRSRKSFRFIMEYEAGDVFRNVAMMLQSRWLHFQGNAPQPPLVPGTAPSRAVAQARKRADSGPERRKTRRF